MPGRPVRGAGRELRPASAPLGIQLLGLVLLLLGGVSAGAVLRSIEREPHPGFGRLYTAAWAMRAGVPLDALYDDTRFARMVEETLPTGGVARWSTWPPGALLPALPFTGLRPSSARLAYGVSGLVAILGGLLVLGALADRGRGDWFLLVGITLGSHAFAQTTREGDVVPWLFLGSAILQWADERGRFGVRGCGHASLGLLGAYGGLHALSFLARGRNEAVRWSLGILAAGVLGMLVLGARAHAAWARALAAALSSPADAGSGSLPGLISRIAIRDPIRNPSAAFDLPWLPLLVSLALLVLSVHATHRLLPRGHAGERGRFLAAVTALSLLFQPVAKGDLLLLAAVPLWTAFRITGEMERPWPSWAGLLVVSGLILGPSPGLPSSFVAHRLLGVALLWAWLVRGGRRDRGGRAIAGTVAPS